MKTKKRKIEYRYYRGRITSNLYRMGGKYDVSWDEIDRTWRTGEKGDKGWFEALHESQAYRLFPAAFRS